MVHGIGKVYVVGITAAVIAGGDRSGGDEGAGVDQE